MDSWNRHRVSTWLCISGICKGKAREQEKEAENAGSGKGCASGKPAAGLDIGASEIYAAIAPGCNDNWGEDWFHFFL